MPVGQWVRRLRRGAPIVVVSGLPRSGTSMAMRMLAAGGMPVVMDGIRAADEDNPNGYFEVERVKELARDPDKAWLHEARGKAIKIISYLLESLPESNAYRVLFLNRDLHEVLASQARMLERRGEASDTSDARMLGVYEKHLEQVRRMLRTRDGFAVCDLDYRQVIADPSRNAARIAEFVGRPLDTAAMAAAVDAALYRNRRSAAS
jgi:hypothetical protein